MALTTKPNHAVLYIIQYISIMKKYAKFCAISVHFLLCQSPQFSFLITEIEKLSSNSRLKYEKFSISFSFILPLLIFWFPAVNHLFIIYTKINYFHFYETFMTYDVTFDLFSWISKFVRKFWHDFFAGEVRTSFFSSKNLFEVQKCCEKFSSST